MTFKVEFGDTIAVRNKTTDPWYNRTFVALVEGVYHCKSLSPNRVQLEPWEFASAIPVEPEPTPFTHDTWPKQVIWWRSPDRENDKCFMVTGLLNEGIFHKGVYYSFELMSGGYEISLDFCQTWQPCHYVPYTVVCSCPPLTHRAGLKLIDVCCPVHGTERKQYLVPENNDGQ